MPRSRTRNRNRPLNRRVCRTLLRHNTRMLGGAPRPRPEDEIAVICRAVKEVMRIDKSLRPFMQEQKRFLEDWLHHVEPRRALDKIYGPQSGPATSRYS